MPHSSPLSGKEKNSLPIIGYFPSSLHEFGSLLDKLFEVILRAPVAIERICRAQAPGCGTTGLTILFIESERYFYEQMEKKRD